MSDKPVKQTWRLRSMWLAIYALLCGCEFVIDTLKDFVGQRITGKKDDAPGEPKEGA
jgi:hypothetical protein